MTKIYMRMYYNLLQGIRKNKYEYIREYIDAGGDLQISGNEILKCAIKHNAFECVEELLRYVEPNYSGNYVGATPLGQAVRSGLPGLVEMLLEKGALVCGITDEDWAVMLLDSSGYFYSELQAVVAKYKQIQNN